MRRYSRDEWSRVFDDVVGERLAGMGDQGIYEQSATKRFPIGARKVVGGRVFRYGYTANGIDVFAKMARLVINSNYNAALPAEAVGENSWFGNVHFVGGVPIPSGSPYIDGKDTALRVVNYYQGGYLVVHDDQAPYIHQHNIIASEVGNGTYVRFWLDEPTFGAIPLLNSFGNPVDMEAWPSPYSAVEEALTVEIGFEPFVGMTLGGKIEPARYIWVMTAGPVWVQCTNPGAAGPGGTIDHRVVYAHQNGTIDPFGTGDEQIVGYVLYVSMAAKEATMIMLQLDH